MDWYRRQLSAEQYQAHFPERATFTPIADPDFRESSPHERRIAEESAQEVRDRGAGHRHQRHEGYQSQRLESEERAEHRLHRDGEREGRGADRR